MEGIDGDVDVVSYRPKRHPSRKGYAVVVENGESCKQSHCQYHFDSCPQTAQGAGHHRREIESLPSLRQICYWSQRFAGFDEILEVCKINRVVPAAKRKRLGKNAAYVRHEIAPDAFSCPEDIYRESGLTDSSRFSCRHSLLSILVIGHLRPLILILEFGTFNSSSVALTSSLGLLRLLIQHLIPFMLILNSFTFRL